MIPDTIIGQILIYCITGGIGGGLGSFVALKVQGNEIKHINRTLETHAQAKADATEVNRRLADHDKTLERAIYRDHCEACQKMKEQTERHQDSKHRELLDRFENLEGETRKLRESLQTCLSDLVSAIKDGGK